MERAHPCGVKTIVALPGPDDAPAFPLTERLRLLETALGEPYHYYANGHIASIRLADVASRPAAPPRTCATGPRPSTKTRVRWLSHLTDHMTASGARIRTSSDPPRENARVGPDRLAASAPSFTRDFKTAAFVTADDRHLPEIAVSALAPFRPRTLTNMTAQTAGWTLGPVSLVQWKSTDGAEIEGVLHKPADFQAGKRYPLLVVIHCGPTGISRALMAPGNRYYPIETFLARGALVLEPNYRGSAGYGGAFRALNVRNLGVGDMADVMSGVDALVAQGLADPDRLGVMGWSQGGYISAFLATNTDRFKAISVGAGISDWMTYTSYTDITLFTRQYLHATPRDDDPEIYAAARRPWRTSRRRRRRPRSSTARTTARPIPNAYQLFRGLRDQGVPATMIVYAGYGHGITKPKIEPRRPAAQPRLVRAYIWGEPWPPTPPRGRGEAAP